MTKEKISRLLKIQVSRQRNLSHISALEGAIFLFVCLFVHDCLGRVVRKPVNANPGYKVNRGNNFPSIKM